MRVSPYGWIIDKVHDGDEKAGILGPGGVSDAMCKRLRAGEGHEFRLYDDDKHLCYSGRFIEAPSEALSDYAFGPLDDYGTPNYGCTEIHYKNTKGEWEQL